VERTFPEAPELAFAIAGENENGAAKTSAHQLQAPGKRTNWTGAAREDAARSDEKQMCLEMLHPFGAMSDGMAGSGQNAQ